MVVRAKETNYMSCFISMIRLISACVTAVASLLAGRNSRWVAVFDNSVDNSKMREVITQIVENSKFKNIFENF